MTAPKRKLASPFEGVTLDHVRTLVAVANEGNFSAAARRLGRVQSAVSQAMATLESFVGFKVFDRSGRVVTLTERGRLLVVAGRRLLDEADRMRDLSEAFRAGRDERLALAVDALFPSRALVSLAHEMRSAFPSLALRIEMDTLASIGARIARRECDVGIAGPLGTSEGLERIAVGSVLLVPVAARSHPLASVEGRIATEVAAAETQIVLSEHGVGASGGLGWGNLPEPLVREDLRRGDLVRLALAGWHDEEHRLPLALVFPPAIRRRPIVRWLVASVPTLCASWGVGLSGASP